MPLVRRVQEKKKMYEVEVRVYDREPTSDLENFFEQTKNFGKRFYHIDKVLFRDPRLIITALAVSRDVSYILRWKIRCNQLFTQKQWDDGILGQEMNDKEIPGWGLEPANGESLRCYFPNAQVEVKEYTDTFRLHGFIKAEKLKKNGISIV